MMLLLLHLDKPYIFHLLNLPLPKALNSFHNNIFEPLFRKYILYRPFINGTDINGIYDEKLRLLSGCY